MTTLIIGLIAALGIGGGLALAGGSGGGGGSDPAPVYEEVYNNPSSQPNILSILATAERYRNAQTVMTNQAWEDYIAVQAGNNKIQITSDAPRVENGRFVYDVVQGYLEDAWGPYSVEITNDNYQRSDNYADYYSKTGAILTGLYNMKDFSSQPDNWVQENITLTEKLALGGNKLGLRNSEFGYHQQDINSSNFGAGTRMLNSFYMYDDTKLASASRSDTATFSGNLLGGIEGLDNDGADNFLPYNLTGTATATLDFATNNLLAKLNTKLNNKTYHSFDLTGTINSPSDFSISSMAIDSSKGIDNSLNAYRMSSIYGRGNGKILSDDTQTELVGQLDFSGTFASGLYPELYGNLSFGMVEGRSNPEGGASGSNGNENPVNNVLVRAEELAMLHGGYFYDQLEQCPIIFGEDAVSVTSPLLEVYLSGGSSYRNIPYTTDITVNDYQNSDLYASYYSQTRSTDLLRDILALGKEVTGLQHSNFGYHRQEMWYTPNENWIGTGYGSVFYLYDSMKLATTIRSDEVSFQGSLLGNIGADALVDGQRYGTGYHPLKGTLTATIDFTTNNLSAYLDTKLNDKEYLAFNVMGIVGSPSSFSISNMEVDHTKSIDASLSPTYQLSTVTASGGGVLLSGSTQEEMVGNINFSGPVEMLFWNNETHSGTLYGSLSFGAKEVH